MSGRQEKHNLDMKKKRNYSYIAAAFFACFISALIFIVSGKVPGGKHIFLIGDYYVQYIHFIKMFWRNLLNGNGLEYSFSFSLGQPVWPIYAYYSLSPCNLPFALIKDVDTAAFLAVLLREGISAVTFCAFARGVLRSESLMTIVFSVLYALCGYNICFYFNVNLMDAVYQLPLLAYGIWLLVREEKKNLLIAVLAYCFTICFYSGFQLGFFSAIMFFGMLLFCYDGEIKFKIRKCLSYGQSVLISVFISAVVTVPTAFYLLQNRGSDVQKFEKLGIWIWDVVAQLLIGQNGGMEGKNPTIYCGLFVLLMIPYLLWEKKIEKSEKKLFLYVLIVLLVVALFDPLYRVMHAFDMPDGSQHRYAYMFSFVLLSGTVRAWENGCKEGFKGYRLMYVSLAWVVISLVLFMITGKNGGDDQLALKIGADVLFLLGFAMVFRRYTDRRCKEGGFAVVMLLECLLNGFLCLAPDSEIMIRSGDYYRLWQQQAEEALMAISKDDAEKTFYRISYDNPIHTNEACFYGFHGVGYFCTIENASLRDTLKRLGYYTLPAAVHENGSTEVMQMILGQRYKVHATYPLYEGEEQFYVRKNENTLPIAFMVSDQLKSAEFISEDPFLNQNTLIGKMLGTEVCELFSDAGEPNVESYNMELLVGEEVKTWRKTEEGIGMIRFTIPVYDRRAFCYFSDVEYEAIGGTMPMAATALDGGDISALPYLAVPRIMEMGLNENGEYEADIVDRDGDNPYAVYRNAYFTYFDEDLLRNACAQLKTNGMEVTDWDEHSICGKISVEPGHTLMFTSIPYDEDWQVMIDGRAVQSIKVVNDSFLAAELEPGEHFVELRYRNPRIRIGMVFSVAGILLWIISAYIEKRQRDHRKDNNGE